MTMKALSLLVGIAACALSTGAFAYTLSGTIPAGKNSVTIDLHKPLERGNVSFTFKAPAVNAGVRYDVDFCIGPADNPCGSTLSHAIEVPAGETRTFSIDALVFSCNVLTAGQGTRVAVPYSVEVTQP
jgi:hypothetical protein